jgi:hypothetical protein
MDQEIAQLTQSLTAYLSPFLPYLVDAGKQAAEAAGKEIAGEALAKAKTLWGKLAAAVRRRPAAAEAVDDVARHPADADAQAALRVQLRKILSEDEDLARTVARLLADTGHRAQVIGGGAVAQGPGAVAAGEVAVGRDLHGNVTIGGGGRKE